MVKKTLSALTTFVLVGLSLTLPQLVLSEVSEVDDPTTTSIVATESATPRVSSSAANVKKQSKTKNWDIKHTPDYETEKAALLKTFKAQILDYQQVYKEFVIAKKQFEKLQTIKSLNDALEATRQAALKRNEVLTTYIQILHLELIQVQPSLDPERRGKAIKEAESLISKLKDKHKQLESLVTREDLYQFVSVYPDFFKKVIYFSYQAKFILRTDQLYRMSLILKDFREEVAKQQEAVTNGNKLKELQFVRGLDEVDKELENIDQVFSKIKLKTYHDERTSFDWYKEAKKDLTDIYTASTRATDYLIELLTLNKKPSTQPTQPGYNL